MIAGSVELDRDNELIVFDTESEWLDGRQSSIGSSDGATILDEGYAGSSRYSLWAEKCHGIKPEFAAATLKRLAKGKLAEQCIAGYCKLDFNWDIQYDPKPSFRRSRIRPWLTASLDAWMIENGRPVAIEIKNVNDAMRREWDVKSGKAPLKYTIQLQHQLLVTGWEMGYLVAQSGYDLYKIPVARHDSLIEMMLSEYEDFWELVKNKKEPEIDDSDATCTAINRVYTRQPMNAHHLDDEESALIDLIAELEQSIKIDEKTLAKFKNQLAAVAKGNDYLVTSDGVMYSYTVPKGGVKKVLKLFKGKV